MGLSMFIFGPQNGGQNRNIKLEEFSVKFRSHRKFAQINIERLLQYALLLQQAIQQSFPALLSSCMKTPGSSF